MDLELSLLNLATNWIPLGSLIHGELRGFPWIRVGSTLYPLAFYPVEERDDLHLLLEDTVKPECDGLYMLSLGSGTIRKCGLVRIGVSLWVWALRPSV